MPVWFSSRRSLNMLKGSKNLLIAAIVLLSNISLALASSHKPNEILVKYKEGIRRNKSFMESLYSSVHVEKVKRFRGGSSQLEHLFTKAGTDIKSAIAELQKNPAVEYAQPNYLLYAFPIEVATKSPASPSAPSSAPGDELPEIPGLPCIPGFELPGCIPLPCFLFPDFPGCGDIGKPKERPPVAEKPAEVNPPVEDPQIAQTYGLEKISAKTAWKVTKGSQDIVVAVIDTGVDYNHEDLSYNLWRNPKPEKQDIVGWDFVHNDHLPYDDNMHGTHVSGTIGAVGENGKGVSGVNQRVSIMALKFLGAQGQGDTASAVKAIDYAIEHGAKVLNNSWGAKAAPNDPDNAVLQDAVKRVEKAGALFIAAAGNDSSDNDSTPTVPANYDEPNLISVAATDEKDALAFFSNYGLKKVHLGAPGANILSSVPDNKYKSASGTSMATPHVAGAAALVWASQPSLTYAEVKARLLESVDKLPSLEGKTITGGRLNLARAVKAEN